MFSPYARCTYYSYGNVSLFLDGGFTLALGDADGISVGISPGISFEFNDRFSIEASLGFLGYVYGYEALGERSDGFGFYAGTTSLSLGLYYSF